MAFRPALSPRNVQRCLAPRRGRPYSTVERWNDVPYRPSPLFPAALAPDGWSRRDDVSTARSSLNTPAIQALLVDAAGTLLVPAEPSAKVYRRYARKYSRTCPSEEEILHRFRAAYNAPYTRSAIRYVGDARPFWRDIVTASTGIADERLFEDLYRHFALASSWEVAPGALQHLLRIRASGVKLAVVSNFDTRLRPILRELGLAQLFHNIIVSAEVGMEKPNPMLFETACEALGVPAAHAIHVGDDRRNDVVGARSAGCYAWLWGQDVLSFAEVERRLATGNLFDCLT